MNPAPSLELGPRTHLVRMTYAWRIVTILPPLAWIIFILIVAGTSNLPLTTPDLIVFVVSTVILLIPLIIVWVWHPTIEVSLHENGIAHKSFSTVVTLPWSEVLYVQYRAVRRSYHGVSVATNYYVTIYGKQKQKIKLSNNLKDGVQVINLVLAKILEIQIPLFSALLEQGKEIPFGELALSEKGIRHGKRLASWDSISELKVAKGKLRIALRGKWLGFCAIPFSSIPNAHAFVQLSRGYLPESKDGEARSSAVE